MAHLTKFRPKISGISPSAMRDMLESHGVPVEHWPRGVIPRAELAASIDYAKQQREISRAFGEWIAEQMRRGADPDVIFGRVVG